MNVTLPNGKTIRNVPDGTSKDAIMAKAISAGLATEEDFGVVAELRDDMPTPADMPESQIDRGIPISDAGSILEIGSAPELNALSVPAFKASIGLLSTGDTESLKGILSSQFGNDVSFYEDPELGTVVNLPSGQYALNRPGLSGQDIARGMFDFAAFTPAGRAASIPAAIVKSAVTETVLEATEQELGGEDISGGEIALAGGIGGFFKGVEDLVGAGYRAYKGRAGDALVEAGREAGIPVLTSDVFQPKTFVGKTAQQTAEKIPIAGTGGMREVQQAMRKKAVSDVAEKYGQFSYDSIISSLKAQKSRIKKAAGGVLNSTGRKLDDAGVIPLNNTTDAIADASSELSKKGVIKSGAAIDDLQTLMQALDDAPQTFTTLKENRTAFNDIIKGADKAERSQLSSRAKGLLTKVERAMKSDMDEMAKINLSPREYGQWKKANNIYAEEAVKLTKTRLKNVLDKGDVTPEAVQTLLFSQKGSELDLLYNSLTYSGKSNARSAFISKIIDGVSRRGAGLTPNAFLSEMKKYPNQVKVLFKGKDRKQMEGLLKALDATKRAQEAAITTPTGQQLLGAGTLAAAVTDLGATVGVGGSVGGLARLYESAPVRNALLRLSSAPKGSMKFERALSELRKVLSSASQTVRIESEDNR